MMEYIVGWHSFFSISVKIFLTASFPDFPQVKLHWDFSVHAEV